MSLPPEEQARVSKLPVWAQKRIDYLVRDLERAEDERDDLRQGKLGPEDTDTWLSTRFVEGGPDIALPKGAEVRFLADYSQRGEIRVRLDDYGGIRISGEGGISIEPQASNVVLVKPRKDY